jgi:hypothetical protein
MPAEEMGDRAMPQPPAIDTRIVLWLAGGFILFVAVVMTGLLFYLRQTAPQALQPPIAHPFPAPALQTTPSADLAQFEARQRAELSGYAWVDRDHSIARIPIEDAVHMIVGRGEHAYDPLEQPASKPPANPGAGP